MMSDATWAVSKENLTASLSIVLCFFLMVQLQPNEPLELPSGMGKAIIVSIPSIVLIVAVKLMDYRHRKRSDFSK